MHKRSIFLAPFFILTLHADETITVPEGKIIDYPSLYQDITPSAGPRVIDGYGVFLTGDYLYWTGREQNLQFAYSGQSALADTPTATDKGKLYGFHFGFRSGFRVGLGFSFGHDKWDLSFNYTWFQADHNHGSAKLKNSSTLLFPGYYIPLSGYEYLTSAQGGWKLHFNALNLELGRNFYVSKFLSLRPFFGLNSSWQRQHLSVDYLGILSADSAVSRKYHLRNALDFWGIGLRAGVDTAWHLASNWSLYGDLALSTLWGQFSNTRKDSLANVGNPWTSVYHVSGGFHTIVPVVEIGVGLRKEEWFCNDRFHLAAQLGWEEQVWFDMNQYESGPNLNHTGGNLILQGLTARLRFDF